MISSSTKAGRLILNSFLAVSALVALGLPQGASAQSRNESLATVSPPMQRGVAPGSDAGTGTWARTQSVTHTTTPVASIPTATTGTTATTVTGGTVAASDLGGQRGYDPDQMASDARNYDATANRQNVQDSAADFRGAKQPVSSMSNATVINRSSTSSSYIGSNEDVMPTRSSARRATSARRNDTSTSAVKTQDRTSVND